METIEILIGALGLLVAFGVGIWSLIFAKIANRKAEEATQAAEAANGIATQAIAQAAEANKIAEDANQLSEEANTFAQRTLAQQEEDWFVDWRVQWDEKDSLLTLRNIGANTAHEMSAIITSGPIHHLAQGLGEVTPGGEVSFKVPEIAEHRVERDLETHRETMALFAFGNYSKNPNWRQNTKIMIRWKSGLGFPGSKLLEKKLA